MALQHALLQHSMKNIAYFKGERDLYMFSNLFDQCSQWEQMAWSHLLQPKDMRLTQLSSHVYGLLRTKHCCTLKYSSTLLVNFKAEHCVIHLLNYFSYLCSPHYISICCESGNGFLGRKGGLSTALYVTVGDGKFVCCSNLVTQFTIFSEQNRCITCIR